jgi:hypothetical protein
MRVAAIDTHGQVSECNGDVTTIIQELILPCSEVALSHSSLYLKTGDADREVGLPCATALGINQSSWSVR